VFLFIPALPRQNTAKFTLIVYEGEEHKAEKQICSVIFHMSEMLNVNNNQQTAFAATFLYFYGLIMSQTAKY